MKDYTTVTTFVFVEVFNVKVDMLITFDGSKVVNSVLATSSVTCCVTGSREKAPATPTSSVTYHVTVDGPKVLTSIMTTRSVTNCVNRSSVNKDVRADKFVTVDLPKQLCGCI